MIYIIVIRFVPLKFEEIFSKHAQTNSDALTGDELKTMLKANREPKNYFGWLVHNFFINYLILF